MRSETNLIKKMNKKGFTLAELLIVVAIIAVLVASAIPVFTAQLEKSREATDMANIRSAYATVISDYLLNADSTKTIPVDAKQAKTGWQNSENGKLTYMNGSNAAAYPVISTVTNGSSYSVGITVDANGNVTPNVTAGS